MKVLVIVSALLVAGEAYATPNTPGQNEMNEVNHRIEYKIARDDCATQLGIVLPPSPHVNKQLSETDRTQMVACLTKKGFTKKKSAAVLKQRAVSGQ